jgi:hypothetical protein
MICYLLIYKTFHELFVNHTFLVLVWIWLHACLSCVSCLGLVKLILYHVNSVTIQKPKRINIAGFLNALKPEQFTGGDNFKRWQT